MALLDQACRRSTAPVLAAGGVSSLNDLRILAGLSPLGLEGCVLGRALFAGTFTLPEALDAVRAR
ncbi:HisA/HisF-related TIM barrel protein [Streptomyces sp. NPDC002994]|uniref:HisA/HisF-related TIM barrel protein n=1 Tax=Streptomyces sp. NPDC002994 TaxID=3154441 RepID=UPI0033AE9638